MSILRPAQILVVEDDVELRNIMVETLLRQGLSVSQAEHGLAAKLLFDAQRDAFDLIVTDIQMPHLTGVELLRHVREYTQKPVILMSGYAQDLEAKTPQQLGASAFLEKPFRAETLVSAVTKCLRSG